MSFLKTLWKKGDLVNAKDFNRYEDTLVEHDTTLPVLEETLVPLSEVELEVSLKADKEAVDAEDAKQATKTEVGQAIEPMKNKTTFDGQNLLKASKSYVAIEDNKLASKQELTTAFQPKAEKSYVDTQDEPLLTKTSMASQLELKADKSYVIDKDALKADKTYVIQRDNLLAEKTELTNGFAPKADKSYVDEKDALLATKTETTAAAGAMVNREYVDQGFNGIGESLKEETRHTQNLEAGLNVVTADVATPLDLEIKGRTLFSMGNSNLEAEKKYVLADEKTKVLVDNQTVSGIGKFAKEQTTRTIADFDGKTAGDMLGNPHFFGHLHAGQLQEPSVYVEHIYGYEPIKQIGGSTAKSGQSHTAGGRASHLFTFNVIEQVEKALGLIPSGDKVEWLKNNVESMKLTWHGWGVSPAGAKATVLRWASEDWITPVSHNQAQTSIISYAVTRFGGVERPSNFIGGTNDGFVHFLVHADSSDGTVGSEIFTDYVSLEVELKSTAQLNTRGKIIRVENFEGKIAGSAKENPHYAGRVKDVALTSPDSSIELKDDNTILGYWPLTKLGGDSSRESITMEGRISQQLFSFNLIEAVERNIGKIPASNIGGKVDWLKNNASEFRANWHGYGSGPSSSNKVVLTEYKAFLPGWGAGWTAYSNEVTKLTAISKPSYIDSNGLVHFLVYAEASDGVDASTVYTDYIELEIELKPTANFFDPKVPLYEVTTEEYEKIGLEWGNAEVRKRFPTGLGVSHITNPYVVAEGDNLIPPFTAWSVHQEASVITPYELRLNSTGDVKISNITINVVPNEEYTLQFGVFSNGCKARVRWVKDSGENAVIRDYTGGDGVSIRVPNEIHKIRIDLYNDTGSGAGTFNFSSPVLTLGNTAKPFVPRNTSYLQVQEKLGAIGGKKDVLFYEDGEWKSLRVIEKDIELEGSMLFGIYNHSMIPLGSRGFTIRTFQDGRVMAGNVSGGRYLMRRHDGSIASKHLTSGDGIENWGGDSYIYGTVFNHYTGFTDGYATTSVDWQRYFNGWKYTDGITWVSVTGNGQTATAQVALSTKPNDYQPYKLSYVLAKPLIEEVMVEGDVVVAGDTQVEVGSGVVVREKFEPIAALTNRYVGYTATHGGNNTSYSLKKLLAVYQDGKDVTHLWSNHTVSPEGYNRYHAREEDYVQGSQYTVTYMALEAEGLLSDAKVAYTKNIRSAHDDLAAKISDSTTQLSVHERSLVDLYTRLRALESN